MTIHVTKMQPSTLSVSCHQQDFAQSDRLSQEISNVLAPDRQRDTIQTQWERANGKETNLEVQLIQGSWQVLWDIF